MDQLRRGASIVGTDLARAPQPASLRDCYQLMCITTPEADQIEASIATLKEEIDTRKAAVADKEALLANHNPPVFQAVQVSTVAVCSILWLTPLLCVMYAILSFPHMCLPCLVSCYEVYCYYAQHDSRLPRCCASCEHGRHASCAILL